MKRTLAILFLAWSVPGVGAAQQRPLVTEDPETIGPGNILIEGGFDSQRDVFYPASGLRGDLFRFPTLGVSFGFSSILELQVDGGIYNRLSITAIEPTIATATGDSPPGNQATDGQQRERARSRYDGLLRDRSVRQDDQLRPRGGKLWARHPLGSR